MSTNKGGRAMAAQADDGPRNISDDRAARARVKMRRELRRRGNLGPLAHLPAAELIRLIKESKQPCT